MKETQKDVPLNWTTDPDMAARYAPVHDMVTEILARIDPGGYAEMLEGFRDDWKPEGADVRIVELMADAASRLRGCGYLEAEIMNKDMEACAGPGVTPDIAQGLAFIRDFKGPKLLDKLSRYRGRLTSEFSRCTRILRLHAKNRKYAEARIAATLAKSKPCTSVIQ